jgi:hypothetical protein
MIENSKIIRQGLSGMYEYASKRFKRELPEARKEFDLLVPIPPADDTEMRNRLIMFSHWFLMDRIVESGKTPADIFFQDNLLNLSYQEEALYRALRISRIGIYSVTERHGDHVAVDVATGERFEFHMDMDIKVHSSGEIMTMRFITMEQKTFLIASYATHHYSTKAFIHVQLSMLNLFDRIAFSRKVFELTTLSIKSRKYTWVEPLSIYQGITRL